MSEYTSRLVVEMDYNMKKRFKVACLQCDTEMSEEIRRMIEHRIEELEKQAMATKGGK